MKLSDLLLVGFFVLYLAVMVGAVAFLRWRRKSRWPFKREDRLLRVAGETLRRRITTIDEQFLLEFVIGMGVSALLLLLVIKALTYFPQLTPGTKLAILAAALVGNLAIFAVRIGKVWQQRQNNFLGWFGERMVGERLDQVRLRGWHIFHDVPFEGGGKKYNLDHVAVGEGGVFVFETKTRRKGHARPGRKDSEVIFDGKLLDWPWGADDHGLAQAEANAQTLATWIKAEIGERVHVTPYLVIPCWFVVLKPAANGRLCRVANEKWLGDILERAAPSLSARQVELISRRLESRCRDVEE